MDSKIGDLGWGVIVCAVEKGRSVKVTPELARELGAAGLTETVGRVTMLPSIRPTSAALSAVMRLAPVRRRELKLVGAWVVAQVRRFAWCDSSAAAGGFEPEGVADPAVKWAVKDARKAGPAMVTAGGERAEVPKEWLGVKTNGESLLYLLDLHRGGDIDQVDRHEAEGILQAAKVLIKIGAAVPTESGGLRMLSGPSDSLAPASWTPAVGDVARRGSVPIGQALAAKKRILHASKWRRVESVQPLTYCDCDRFGTTTSKARAVKLEALRRWAHEVTR
jgi:hypothetical protein